MSKKGYKKFERHLGIYQNRKSQNYLAVKKIAGKNFQKTFSSLSKAMAWRTNLIQDQSSPKTLMAAKLKHVWASMQEIHFPSLSPSTQSIWLRRFRLLRTLEELRMDEITSSKITSWVNEHVQYFKLNSERPGQGNSGRCNLNKNIGCQLTYQ